MVAASQKKRTHTENEQNQKLVIKIKEVKAQHPAWGYKRITAWLRKREGLRVNPKRILRLIRLNNLLVPRNLKLRATRKNSENTKNKPKTIVPNQYWGTDMTKIMLPNSGWAYLHIVIDWGDKKLLAAHLSRTSKSSDWIEALEQAVNTEFPYGIRNVPAGCDTPDLVSDHGSQPTSAAFMHACKTLGINQIFASYGNPKGNADTERMMRTIKEDLIYPNDFQTFNELETTLKEWMKQYNEVFPHSALGYDTPVEYEEWFYRATRTTPPYCIS